MSFTAKFLRVTQGLEDFNLNEGGGKGGGSSAPPPPAPVYTPPPVAPRPAAEASTQATATTPEEEAKKIKESQRSGAKSLQIPLIEGGAVQTVGTI